MYPQVYPQLNKSFFYRTLNGFKTPFLGHLSKNTLYPLVIVGLTPFILTNTPWQWWQKERPQTPYFTVSAAINTTIQGKCFNLYHGS